MFIEDKTFTAIKDRNILSDQLRALAKRIETVLAARAPDSFQGKYFVYDVEPLSAR